MRTFVGVLLLVWGTASQPVCAQAESPQVKPSHAADPSPAMATVSVAVARDGTVWRRKDLIFDRKAGLLRRKKKEYPLAEFYLVEGKNGALLWTPDYATRLRGYEFLARAEVLERAKKLFKNAVKYKDPKLARELFNVAQEHGLDGRDVEKSREKLIRLERRPGKRSSKADAVSAEAKLLANIQSKLFVQRTMLELKSGRPEGLRMLRDALRAAPKNKLALTALNSRAPKVFALGDARAWLDWHLDVEVLGAKLGSRDTFNMRQSLKHWRKDLNAIESGVVLVITPVTDSRILGRTLGCCRMTSNILSELFADYPVRRRKFDPLRIFLFENRKEYLRESQAFSGTGDTEFLEWTAGFYSPSEGISRLYWRTDRDAENRIIGTAVHELTHHWLAEANPAYSRAEARRSSRSPGYWIVEGFAEFMEEGSYNLDNRTWSLFDRRAPSLDTLVALASKAGSRSKTLIPWKDLYEGTAVDFATLDLKTKYTVRRRWRLGADTVSKKSLWYVQAAATCQFLYHAEKGKYRKALLDYVVNNYTNKKMEMAIQLAFGMTPQELGARVEEFARQVRDGWRPPLVQEMRSTGARNKTSPQEAKPQKIGPQKIGPQKIGNDGK